MTFLLMLLSLLVLFGLCFYALGLKLSIRLLKVERPPTKTILLMTLALFVLGGFSTVADTLVNLLSVRVGVTLTFALLAIVLIKEWLHIGWLKAIGVYLVSFLLVVSVLAVPFALSIRTFVYQAFTIPSGAMLPTLQIGDYMLANKFLYRFTSPRRGDIIVFKYPLDERRDFLKRIIAVGGERLVIRDGQVFINGQPIAEPYVETGTSAVVTDRSSNEPCLAQAAAAAKAHPYQFGPITIPEGHYFVMGDNRNNSQDSRYWGCLREQNVKGKVVSVYWSWDRTDGTVRWERIGTRIK